MVREEVRIESDEGVALAGSLVFPDGAESAPVVLLLAGSGKLDRNSNVWPLKLNILSVLAEQLASAGIASLRYDKRGCAKSTGDYYSAGHAEFVNDAKAAAQFLLSHQRVKNDRVFILGHSEGALIAPQVAAQLESIFGLVLICPTSQDFADVLFAQAKHVTQEVNSMPGIKGVFTRLVLRFTGSPIQQQQEVLTKLGNDRSDVFEIKRKKINAKWFREMLLLDTKEIYRKIECSTLVLGGGKDVQCDPSDVLEVRNLMAGPVVSYVLPNMTHLLRDDSEPKSILRYRKLAKQPVSQALVDHVLGWLKEKL